MILTAIFWFSIATLIYVFFAYPLILVTLGSIIRKPHVSREPQHLKVSLIISAYNEESVIKDKLENSLSLDYPRDQFEILVISDASTDQTDAIVESYASKGVVLKRMPVRKGKTDGLNDVVPFVNGDILVFSDANTLYAADAIRKLARNFADPTVGCVTGDSRYINFTESQVGRNENSYWSYERLLKTRESQLGSTVGSDGAIFAIRKNLYTALESEDINDFVTPLQIVSRGYRCVFEPEAICYESTMAHYDQEFRRKVRVVNRSWNALFRVKQLLNPFRYGWFSIQLISHKLLRWLTPFFLLLMLTSSFFLSFSNNIYFVLLLGQFFFAALSLVGLASQRFGIATRWLSFPYYFMIVNSAAAVGIIKSLLGQKIQMWEPERENQHPFCFHPTQGRQPVNAPRSNSLHGPSRGANPG